MTFANMHRNDSDAVIVLDRRQIEPSSKKDDNIKKFRIVNGDEFGGVLYWTGERRFTEDIADLPVVSKGLSTIDEYVAKIQLQMTNALSIYEGEEISTLRQQLESSAKAIEDDGQRERFVDSRLEHLMAETRRQRFFATPAFAFVGYERQNGLKVKVILEERTMPIQQKYLVIATRNILAGNILSTDTDLDDDYLISLPVPALLFYGMKSYLNATAYASVGGTPDIIMVSRSPNHIISLNFKTCSLVSNFIGAYAAEMWHGMPTSDFIEKLSRLLQFYDENRLEVSKSVHDTPENLEAGRLPQRVWKNRAHIYNPPA